MKIRTRFPTLGPGGSFVGFMLIAGAMTAPTPSTGEPAPPEASGGQSTDEPEDYSNWVEFSVGGVFTSGDRAKFQQRQQIPGGEVFGGVEDFHWEQFVGESGLFQMDGRAIFDNNDYLFKLSLEDPDKGFFRFGYREFRTWYDGSGGFFPQNRQWFELFDDEMAVDRGEFWAEVGLTLPDRPVVIFRYRHLFRDGRKNSTAWGDTQLTGGFGDRRIVPAFWELDEERDIFEVDVRHHVGRTDWGLAGRMELVDNDNARKMRRRPDEGSDRFLTHREGLESDLYSARGFTETRITEKILFTTGASVTTIDTDISGSRIYGADYDAVYDPLFARRQRFDEGYFGLHGGSKLKQYVANLNLMVTPCEGLTIVPSLRVERQEQDGVAEFIETNVQPSGGSLTTLEEELRNVRSRDFLDVTEAVEARYTGLQNWVLYARAEWLQGEGDLQEDETDVGTGASALSRDTDSDRFTQKYVIGANWYPARRVNLGVQYYHKKRENEYDHRSDSTSNTGGNRYPAFLTAQDFETDDVNIRVTWRPVTSLTLVSRYDFQLSTVDTRGDLLSSVESAEMTTHVFSQTLTWSPLSWLYLQGGVNYVIDEVETPANTQSGAAANLVNRSDNGYWNANAAAGLALDEKTDLQVQYFYYRADNYQDNSAVGLPYGADAQEHSVFVSVSRQLTRNLRCTLKGGYFNNHSRTSGGNNDYDAYLLASSLQYRF